MEAVPDYQPLNHQTLRKQQVEDQRDVDNESLFPLKLKDGLLGKSKDLFSNKSNERGQILQTLRNVYFNCRRQVNKLT